MPGGERTALAALVVAISVLSAWPLVRLLLEGVAPGGRLDLAILRQALEAPATWRAARHTLETGLAGTALALVLGTVFAVVVALTDVRGKPWLVFAFMLPLMVAPQITALAWLQAVGPNSALLRTLGLAPAPGSPNPLQSREGIALLLGLQQAPLVFLTLRAGLRALPRELVEAAQSSGAGPARILGTVVLPLMGPVLVAGGSLAFVSAIGNFGIPALLGIPAGYTVLTTLVYQKLAGFGPAVLAEVAALSLLLGILAIVGVALAAGLAGRLDVRVAALAAARPIWRLGRWRPLVEAGCVVGFVAILLLPLVALLATSLVPAYGVPLRPSTATLTHYAYVVFEHAATRRAFLNSTTLAGGAAALLVCLTVPLGYFLVWRKSRLLGWLAVAAELPYALPGVVLAIAMILVFLKPLPLLGLGLYGTPYIILIAYLARFLALALRPVIGAYLQLDRSLEEAARMAGAGLVFRLRTVVLPLVLPVVVAGATLVFLIAFNELTVSALLWSSGVETLGVVLFSLEQAGDSVSAAAVAVLTVLATLGIMLAATAGVRRLAHPVLPWQA
ncbi:MAG TPA: iron ABC transporter permease [Methylomirabilota bacterium]|nr:iron ABC transporter permease [Methylomirabilota bacterium]